MTLYTANELKALKDSITSGQYDALLGWMELFKDVPSNYSVPAFKPEWNQ
jgi:hypothetical protein